MVNYFVNKKIEMEEKTYRSASKIQAYVKMRRQKKIYAQMLIKRDNEQKLQLQRALQAMESAVTKHKDSRNIDDMVIKLQRAFRICMNRDRFRRNFYKLVLFRNIVEVRMHREEMVMYKAFEKLVRNAHPPAKRTSTAEINGVRMTRVLSPDNANVEEYITLGSEREVSEIDGKDVKEIENEIKGFDAQEVLKSHMDKL